MKTISAFAIVLAFGAVPVFAQEVPASGSDPIVVEGTRVSPTGQSRLQMPANTRVLLRMSQNVTTKGKRWFEGEAFSLAVAQNVNIGGTVVIPAGSRAVGTITWLSNPGVFGKRGKIEVSLEYVETGQQRIELEGTYRQEGGAKARKGKRGRRLFGRMFSSANAVIPRGHQLTATTQYPVTFVVPAMKQRQR